MVIKADVQGSAEALADAVRALKTENASVDVLRAGKTDTVRETERQRDRETDIVRKIERQTLSERQRDSKR